MEEEKKNKSHKKIVIGIIIGIIIIALLGTIVFLLLKLDNNQITSEDNYSDNQSKETTNSIKTMLTSSFKQMEYTDDSLSEEQKNVAKFFDEDFFRICSYEELVRYADMLKGINISIYCEVNEILSSDDENFEAVCEWGMDDEDFWGKTEDRPLESPIIIKGAKPSKMLMKDDVLTVKGKLVGAETKEINGKNTYLPIIEVIEIGENGYLWYSEETIRQTAKAVFGDNIKVRTPTEEEVQKMVATHAYTFQDHVWLIEMENQSNLDFKVFDIWQTEATGLITYNGIYNQSVVEVSEENKVFDLNKKLYITPDLQKYIVFDYSSKDKYVYINVYNRNLDKLWSREISKVSQITWDATNSNLVFVSDNDFYNIDIETGKDIWEPIYVGKKKDIRIVDNGYILLNNSTDDAIMFLDKKGNIKNKYDLDIDLKLDNGETIDCIYVYVQEMDNNYVVLFNMLEEDEGIWSSKYVIIDKNGNKVNESK